MQPNFFDDQSPYLNHPLLTAERTRQEIDFLEQKFGLTAGASVLDVGCGFGRHSIELARRGFDVTGIDPAATMIAAAKEAVSDANFQVADGVEFQSAKQFDVAICLFTTLGQISVGNEDNRDLLATIFRLLKRDGQVLVEVPDRDKFVAAMKPHDRFGNDVAYTDIVRVFDSAEKHSHRTLQNRDRCQHP